MRVVGKVALAAALTLATALAGPVQARSAKSILHELKKRDGEVMVAAHRGCHRQAPENSLSAFRHCLALGVDIVETDVQLTSDGAMVLMHDRTVDRTTDGTGRIADMTLKQVKALRLRQGSGGASAPLTQERVPTFAEALLVMRGGILIDLDAKGPDREAVWNAALPLLRRMNMLPQMTVKLTAGPDDHYLGKVPLLKHVAYLQRATDAGAPLSQVVASHRRYHPVAYTAVFNDLEFIKEGSAAVRASGARLWVEPIFDKGSGGYSDEIAARDPDAAWGVLLDQGGTVFLTDDPDGLILYLNARKRRSPRH